MIWRNLSISICEDTTNFYVDYVLVDEMIRYHSSFIRQAPLKDIFTSVTLVHQIILTSVTLYIKFSPQSILRIFDSQK